MHPPTCLPADVFLAYVKCYSALFSILFAFFHAFFETMFQPVFQAMFEPVLVTTLVAVFLAVLHVVRGCFCGVAHSRGENRAEENEGKDVFAHVESVVCGLL